MFGQITKEQWDKHPSFRKELAEVLSSPAFQAAYGIVLAKGLQTKSLPPSDPLHWAALMGQRKEGYLEALDNLTALTEPPPDARPETTAWSQHRSGQVKPQATPESKP